VSDLRIQSVSKQFAGVTALDDVTMNVTKGERRALIGPNGAGKSTLFHLITGYLSPTRGEIFLNNQDITGLPLHKRANLGLGQTFQRSNLFSKLTVAENIRLVVQHRHRMTHQFLKAATSFRAINQEIDQILAQVGLAEFANLPVTSLAYGQQRVLEMALALAAQPRLLLLDEPTAGMSPAETLEISQVIQDLPRTLTIVIIEHDMDVIFRLADQITVLHYGQIVGQGSPAEVRANPLVQELYLGLNGEHSDRQRPR
jgi:branched-chain amino acid transport system ATP-binding protein